MSEEIIEQKNFNLNLKKRAKSTQIRKEKKNSLFYSSFSNINNINKFNEIFNINKSACCGNKLISNKKDERFSKNLCKEKENCLNIYLILRLQSEIKELLETNLNLEKINECLLKNVNIKNEKLI
jgi:hypothetical protein